MEKSVQASHSTTRTQTGAKPAPKSASVPGLRPVPRDRALGFRFHHIPIHSPLPPVIQRVKAGKYHINDYHFIGRMEHVRQIGVSKQKHTVILESFTDFAGLEQAAAKAAGNSFSFGGFEWMFKGEEIIPTGGAPSVDLSGEEIQALVSWVTQDVDPPKKIAQSDEFQQALQALKRSQNAKKQESKEDHAEEVESPHHSKSDDDPVTTTLSIPYDPDSVLEGVHRERGKAGQVFLWGKGGSKEEFPHIHAFFDTGKSTKKAQGKGSASSTGPVVITSAIATLRPTEQTKPDKRHWNFGSDLKVQRIAKDGKAHDDDEVIAELERVMKAVSKGKSSSASKPAAKKASSSPLDNLARELGLGVEDLIIRLELFGISPEDGKDFAAKDLKSMGILDPDTLDAMQKDKEAEESQAAKAAAK